MKEFFDKLEWTRKEYCRDIPEGTFKIYRYVDAAKDLLTYAEASKKYIRTIHYGKDSMGEFICVTQKCIK